jgi:hypothetical protein
MASEILGLFTTPQQYQQNQLAQFQNRAFQEVQLDPFQQAALGARTAGYQLGQGVGGALGGQDPQLQLIARRQQLLSQLDQSDPTSFARVAKMASDAGDQQLAFGVAEAGRKAETEMARAAQLGAEKMTSEQRNALAYADSVAPRGSIEHNEAFQSRFNQLTLKGEQANKPFEFEVKEAKLQNLKANLRVLESQPNPNPEAIQRIKDSIQAIEGVPKAEPRPSVGGDREGISLDMFDQNYYDLTPTQRKEVNEKIDAKRLAEAEKSKPVFTMTSTQPVEPKDWLKFSEFINKDPLMTRTSSILSDAPAAIQTIKNSTQNNFSSASLPAAIAKFTGEGKNMSNQDIERYTRTGGLDQRIAGDVVGFFTGKKTDVTKSHAEQFVVSLYRGALLERKKFIQDQAEATGYDQTPNYKKTIEQLDKKLAQFKLVTPKGSQNPPTPSSKPEDEALINKYLKP